MPQIVDSHLLYCLYVCMFFGVPSEWSISMECVYEHLFPMGENRLASIRLKQSCIPVTQRNSILILFQYSTKTFLFKKNYKNWTISKFNLNFNIKLRRLRNLLSKFTGMSWFLEGPESCVPESNEWNGLYGIWSPNGC